MSKRYREQEAENLNIWPSFTDLMSNAFMIISLFLLLALFKSLFLKTTAEETEMSLTQTEEQVLALERELRAKNRELQNAARRTSQLERQAERLNTQIDTLNTEVETLKLAPPVVVIENSGEFQFDSGSAELSNPLREYIRTDLVERIEVVTQQRDIYIVEIIGHTDGQATVAGNSNLDTNLEAVAQGDKPTNQLNPGSNADLGLMRALEVVKELQAVQQQGRLQGIQFRAYSAAQLLLPSGEFANPSRQADASRRRIEIRFSPLGQSETVR